MTEKAGMSIEQTPVDEVREAFEAWANTEDMYMSRSSVTGHYHGEATKAAWRAWQAACAYQREQDALICEKRVDADCDCISCEERRSCAASIRNGGQP